MKLFGKKKTEEEVELTPEQKLKKERRKTFWCGVKEGVANAVFGFTTVVCGAIGAVLVLSAMAKTTDSDDKGSEDTDGLEDSNSEDVSEENPEE